MHANASSAASASTLYTSRLTQHRKNLHAQVSSQLSRIDEALVSKEREKKESRINEQTPSEP